MKKFKNRLKLILTIIISAAIIVSSFGSVNAASNTIVLGEAPKTKAYIAGVSFHYKRTTSGQELFCLNMNKNTARNVKAKLVPNSKYITGGLIYILKNGYPNKSIIGDNDKDYYITQTAVWWYLDKTTGSTNLGQQFKSTGSDPHGMRKYVKQLVNEAYNHRNDSFGISDTKLIINTTGSNDMTLKDNYYISSKIKATTLKNVNSYSVTLSGVPSGTKIVKSDGTETTYTKAFTINSKDTFQIKVPVSAIKETSLSITVTATAAGNVQYTAHEYQPEDSSMQNVALLEKAQKNVSSKLTINIE